MIVREIKNNPEIIDNFDWFNDYKDTRFYVQHHCPELLPRFDKGYKEFNKKLNEELKAKRLKAIS